jgi:ABC-type lipoprotein export system ATPase subunit
MGLLDIQTAGNYRFNGIDVAGLRDQQRAGLRSRAIGFVFQAFHLIAHRSVLENVMLSDIYRKYPRRERNERAQSALAQVGLSRRADYLPTRLSGGERQRAAIARAIMGSPRVLLCDEPTGNLDSGTTASILDLFAELNRGGLTIVTITHEADVAQRASRKLRIVDGRIEGPQ